MVKKIVVILYEVIESARINLLLRTLLGCMAYAWYLLVVFAIARLAWFEPGHFFPPMSATGKERAVERVQTDFQHFIALIERVRHPEADRNLNIKNIQNNTMMYNVEVQDDF